MRRFLAWVAVVTALVASRASAADNPLSGAYDVTTSAPSEAPKKSADDKTWLRRESATTVPYTPSPYSAVATTAPAPAKGGSTGVKYEGDAAAVIIPWEGRGAKSAGYSSSRAPTAKPERNDVVEGGDVYGATAKPTTDKRNDSQPRDSVVPVQVNEYNDSQPRDSVVPVQVNEYEGPEWQSTVDDKTDRAWYQRTGAPKATKTSSPYTDVYGESTSSPSATNEKSSVKSVRNTEHDVGRPAAEGSRDDKTAGYLLIDDQVESSYKTSIPRPSSKKPSDVSAEKEASPDSSASYAPTGRTTYKWGKDTSESRGHSKKEEFNKDVAAEDSAPQTADKVKETRRHHSVSGSLDYNGKADDPRVEKADSSSSYGKDSAHSVDAESRGYRNTNSQTSNTKPERPVQDGEVDAGIDAKDRGGTGSRDDHQWHERHQHDEDTSIPSQEHSASSSLEKSSDVYAEKGAAPFDDEETPSDLTVPWGKKTGDSKLKSEHHGYHVEDLKKDAAGEKDSEDSMQADQDNDKLKETHRDEDDDKGSVAYKSTDRSAALRMDASATPVYSEEADESKVPKAKSPYDDSEDVEHSNAMDHSQNDAEGTSGEDASAGNDEKVTEDIESDEKTTRPPSELPSALSEDAPKPPSEPASSEAEPASSVENPDKGRVGVTVPWKAEVPKSTTYSSTDAPPSPLEYHEKTEAKSTALGPVIPWNGGRPQLVREQTNKPSARTESDVYSNEVAERASETRGTSHTLGDAVPWSGGHALLVRGLKAEEQPEEKKPREEPTETSAEEPAEDEKPVETRADEPVEGEESDGLMQTTMVSQEKVRWDQDDCDPCEVPTLPPTLPPIHPHTNDDYMEHLPNVSDVHEAWNELKEAPVPSDFPTKPPRKKAPKPCKEDLKHCIKVIGADGERYECENGYTLTPTEQPTEGPTETPTEIPTETPTESPTETPTGPYEAPTPGTSEPTPAPSQPSEPDEPTPAPSTPNEREPTASPTDEPYPTPAASTTAGANTSKRHPTASTTVKPKAATTEAPSATKTGATTTSDASVGDTAYATGASSTATTGGDAYANAEGASTSEGNSALGGGAIAGIIIACVAFAAVVVGAVLYKQRAIARQREENLFADLSATRGHALETDYAAM